MGEGVSYRQLIKNKMSNKKIYLKIVRKKLYLFRGKEVKAIFQGKVPYKQIKEKINKLKGSVVRKNKLTTHGENIMDETRRKKALDWIKTVPLERRDAVVEALTTEPKAEPIARNINSLSMQEKEEVLSEKGFLKRQFVAQGEQPVYAKDLPAKAKKTRLVGKQRLDTPLDSDEAELIVDQSKDRYIDKKGNKLRPVSKYITEIIGADPLFPGLEKRETKINPAYEGDNPAYQE